MAETWPTTPDGRFWLFEGRVLIPIDPSTGMAQLLLRPQGGVGVGIPAIAKGDPGDTPTISTTINFTELAYDDPSPAAAEWTEVSPNTYELTMALHAGPPGEDGSVGNVMDADDVEGTPATGKILVVNGDGDALEYQYPKVGDRYFPASVTSLSNVTSGTLCSIVIPAQPFDYRPRVTGYGVVTGNGSDLQVDIVARLNDETTGNIVARGYGVPGATPPPIIVCPGPMPGAAADVDKVTAGNAATIHIRAERQSGSATFSVSNTTTVFRVEVQPIP